MTAIPRPSATAPPKPVTAAPVAFNAPLALSIDSITDRPDRLAVCADRLVLVSPSEATAAAPATPVIDEDILVEDVVMALDISEVDARIDAIEVPSRDIVDENRSTAVIVKRILRSLTR
ncbi:hypothetical protein [Bacillus paralicheniformis]|uniref:hypothetical protein n=1 Tax=Bacillus paralicheniformis TaxID=1648923 RepID=UPI002DBC9D9D|nr:hypothetical protein [Bacillus paralicheniformis]MEC1022874.1 hypothetical protein [Bacillus paralicheniformis]MEC1026518.1 hypothetical protein [Bacillus paralicheniformis]MEC1036957.1 hypothetical protein [Bacillus paralicheniformis]MEC1053278.1 hypothetical protein [Bacillus paralicheniformis]MEC1060025.1 hypothetical protein [Bacillus paralicheniformis]